MARKGNNPAILPFDPEDQDSIFHMVPESVQKAMQLINPAWMTWKEATLEKNCDADARIVRIRLKFWDEYFAAKDAGRKMTMTRIWSGTCGERYWRDCILKSPKKMAYILTMPLDYESSIRAAHYMAITRLETILQFPLRTGGKPNLGVADRVMKVFELLDNRVKGVATQRVQIEQKNLNMNVTKDVNHVANNPQAIADEIARLESQIKKLPASEAVPLQVEKEVKTTESYD